MADWFTRTDDTIGGHRKRALGTLLEKRSGHHAQRLASVVAARGGAMTSGATTSAVRQQVAAMGCELFEVGIFRPETAGTDASMLLRVWNPDTLLRAVPWLQLQNHAGRHIYIRPKGEHNLSLVDDLTAEAVTAMDRDGFHPALVVETSPFNFQAWLKHPEPLDKQLSTAAARTLAENYFRLVRREWQPRSIDDPEFPSRIGALTEVIGGTCV